MGGSLGWSLTAFVVLVSTSVRTFSELEGEDGRKGSPPGVTSPHDCVFSPLEQQTLVKSKKTIFFLVQFRILSE